MNIILIVIAVLLALYFIRSYNKFVTLKNYISEAFSTMDVYLKKRWDLIPNLVETVQGYATHEKEIFEKVAQMRSKGYSAMNNEEKLAVNTQMSQVLPNIMAVAENYPDLKANMNFVKLMEDLKNIENDIANSRKYYNGTVRQFNTMLEMFPSNIVGSIFHFQKAMMFLAEENERENVKVSFQ